MCWSRFRAVAAIIVDLFGLFPIFTVSFVVLFVGLGVLRFWEGGIAYYRLLVISEKIFLGFVRVAC